MQLLPAHDFENVSALIADVLDKDPDFGQKALAAALGKSTNAVSRKIRGELSWQADEVSLLLACLHDLPRPPRDPESSFRLSEIRRNYRRILEYQADRINCSLVQKPDQSGECLPTDREMSSLLDKVGTLGSRYVSARSQDSPGGRGLNRDEKRVLIGAVCELQGVAAALLAALNEEQEVETEESEERDA